MFILLIWFIENRFMSRVSVRMDVKFSSSLGLIFRWVSRFIGVFLIGYL